MAQDPFLVAETEESGVGDEYYDEEYGSEDGEEDDEF